MDRSGGKKGHHFDRLPEISSESWLREQFPDKDWHRHPRTDGGTDLCDSTPNDCAERPKVERAEGAITVETARRGDMTPTAVRQINVSLGIESATVDPMRGRERT